MALGQFLLQYSQTRVPSSEDYVDQTRRRWLATLDVPEGVERTVFNSVRIDRTRLQP